MYRFSKKSLRELGTCDERLQAVAYDAIKYVDFSIIEGLRAYERQKQFFVSGKSKTMNSKHLADESTGKSLAFDILPHPFIDKPEIENDGFNDRERFALLAGVIIGIGIKHNVLITWGGDWKFKFDPKSTRFYDAMHFEINKNVFTG